MSPQIRPLPSLFSRLNLLRHRRRVFHFNYCNFADLSSKRTSQIPQSAPVDLKTAVKRVVDRFLISSSFPDTLIKDLSPLSSIPPVVYAGFDPTADSLHIGHLLVINALLHLYSAGVDVITVVGGATAKLGDPSGRSTQRNNIDWETLKRNSDAILAQLDRIIKNFTEHILVTPERRNILKPVRFANNAQWYTDKNVIRFIGEIGPYFRLTHMLEKDSVRLRAAAKEGMHFAEFAYQLFQAYDWLRLYEDAGCQLQIGGTDQIGNMHSGHDLIQRLHDRPAFGLAVPILVDDKGRKLGKTAQDGHPISAVWLDPSKTTPFEFYQHFIRIADSDVAKYLHLFTFLPLDEVEKISAKHDRQPQSRLGQTKLASHLTLLVHGPDGLASAERCTDALYNGTVEKLSGLSEDEFRTAFADVPSVDLQLRNDITILELAMSLEHFSGQSERLAIEIIKNGGLFVNYQKIREPNCVLVQGVHVLPNGITVIRVGKKNYYLVRWH